MTARRLWAWPLMPIYGAALAAGDALRLAGLSKQRRLQWPVISVGSLSAGGAGKTPVTIALATLLGQRGWTADVLTRGYRRRGREVEQVDMHRTDAATHFGDEPTLIAQHLGAPVWVGASRYSAGRAAEEAAQNEAQPEARHVHLLDDGFQHRSLFRQFDLVLVTAADLRDALLPAGNLREPLTALRRADAFAVREEDLDAVAGPLRRFGRPEAPVWTLRRTLQFPPPLGIFGAGLRPLAFCGIARPEDFAQSLTAAGCGLVDTVLFPDHHHYAPEDMATLIRTAKQLKATGFITTEKDAVKLTPEMRHLLQTELGPVMVVALEVHFVYESPVVRALTARLSSRAADTASAEAPVR